MRSGRIRGSTPAAKPSFVSHSCRTCKTGATVVCQPPGGFATGRQAVTPRSHRIQIHKDLLNIIAKACFVLLYIKAEIDFCNFSLSGLAALQGTLRALSQPLNLLTNLFAGLILNMPFHAGTAANAARDRQIKPLSVQAHVVTIKTANI